MTKIGTETFVRLAKLNILYPDNYVKLIIWIGEAISEVLILGFISVISVCKVYGGKLNLWILMLPIFLPCFTVPCATNRKRVLVSVIYVNYV